MYQVSLANTPENIQAIEELGIAFLGMYIESAEYITIQIYPRVAYFRKYACKDSPLITIEHLAPLMLINDVKLSLHYMLGNGLLDRKQIDNMVILADHRI